MGSVIWWEVGLNSFALRPGGRARFGRRAIHGAPLKENLGLGSAVFDERRRPDLDQRAAIRSRSDADPGMGPLGKGRLRRRRFRQGGQVVCPQCLIRNAAAFEKFGIQIVVSTVQGVDDGHGKREGRRRKGEMRDSRAGSHPHTDPVGSVRMAGLSPETSSGQPRWWLCQLLFQLFQLCQLCQFCQQFCQLGRHQS